MSDPQSMPGHRWDSSRLLVEWQKDPQATLLRLRQAANAGDARAQFLLGQIHCEGRGVPIDAVEGLHWYRLAAHAGDATAMNMVGRCHELGRGTAVDESLAAAWYRKAASHGHDWGMYNYANLLATGRGVARDRGEALRLYREAAHQGHAKSMRRAGKGRRTPMRATIGTGGPPRPAISAGRPVMPLCSPRKGAWTKRRAGCGRPCRWEAGHSSNTCDSSWSQLRWSNCASSLSWLVLAWQACGQTLGGTRQMRIPCNHRQAGCPDPKISNHPAESCERTQF
jgi:hypothetical protein